MPRPTSTIASTTWIRALVAIAVGISTAPVAAADAGVCGGGFVLPDRPVLEQPPNAAGETAIEADDADLSDLDLSVLRGDVQVMRDGMQLSADEVYYSKQADTVDARGNVKLWEDGIFVTGTRGVMEVSGETTVLDEASFKITETRGHGTATRLVLSGDDVVKAKAGSYSTCDPADPDWVLRASDVKLTKSENEGIARNVWVEFKGVPIFYSPFLSFPLTEARKSGFLPPSVGVSDTNGFEATVPYYFNILPNMDATVAVRGMSDRGVQLQGEYRYLFPFGSGELGLEVLPNDSKTESTRTGVSVKHRSTYEGDLWQSEIDFGWVSDREYFEDLGTSLSIASRSFLDQRADLVYSRGIDNWGSLWMRTRVQSYFTVDNTLPASSRPYKQLPNFLLQATPTERNKRLNFSGRAEVVNFDRRSSVTGIRWDVEPTVTFPIRSSAGFLVPAASLRYTGYSLDGNAGTSIPDAPSRVLPRFSLDGGLFFERRFKIAGTPLVQTLEPRAFYLFVPYADQDDLPVFDTGEYTFSFAQLFRLDRFGSADRMADAHQVSLALTSRFLRPSDGNELFRASIGQIRYFRDRKVVLPNTTREIDRSSDLVAEVSARVLDPWRFTAGLQWNPSNGDTERSTLSARYQPDSRRVANFTYRFVRNSVEQTDISAAWPLSRQWRAVGRWNYALPESRTLEAFAGVEYESCCWGFRTVVRRYLTNTRGDYTNAIFAQLELKGLTGVGDASEFLVKSIPGYRNEF